MSFELIVTQILHGLVYGMLLFLVASGLTLVFGLMDVLNITHAAWYMLGAYFGYTAVAITGNFWLAFIISPLIVAFISIVVERYLLRHTYKEGHEPQILLTFGLLFIFSELVRIIWGNAPLRLFYPEILSGSISFPSVVFPVYRLFVIGSSILMLLGLYIFLTSTRAGLIIRAAVYDAEMVGALGNNIEIYFRSVFAGGAILAAIAGVTAAPLLTIFAGMGDQILLDCFVVIVVGGFGSLGGVFIASLLLGQLQSLGTIYLPQFALVFQFMLMVAVLIIKPTGLFGEQR